MPISKLLIDQPTAKPTRKLAAATGAGSLVTIVVWASSMAGYPIPGDVAAALVTVVSVIAGWFRRDEVND